MNLSEKIVIKKMLLSLGALFLITIAAYLIRPEQGQVLLEICKTVFPSLATLLIVLYFVG